MLNTTIPKLNNVDAIAEHLRTTWQVQAKVFYKQLVERLTNQERINLYQLCMEDIELIKHASKIHSTFLTRNRGGFDEGSGFNDDKPANNWCPQRKIIIN